MYLGENQDLLPRTLPSKIRGFPIPLSSPPPVQLIWASSSLVDLEIVSKHPIFFRPRNIYQNSCSPDRSMKPRVWMIRCDDHQLGTWSEASPRSFECSPSMAALLRLGSTTNAKGCQPQQGQNQPTHPGEVNEPISSLVSRPRQSDRLWSGSACMSLSPQSGGMCGGGWRSRALRTPSPSSIHSQHRSNCFEPHSGGSSLHSF